MTVVRGLGFALLVPVGLLYLASGLVVPLPWLAGMYALFLGLVVVAVASRERPWRVLAVPAAGVLLWGAIVSAGEALFDWTA